MLRCYGGGKADVGKVGVIFRLSNKTSKAITTFTVINNPSSNEIAFSRLVFYRYPFLASR